MGEAAVLDTGARVLAAWTDILGEGDGSGASVEQGLSFVTAGGHSLAAARLVARLRGELGVEIPLSALLRDDPTADEFVAVVVGLGAGAPVDPSPPVAATPSSRQDRGAPARADDAPDLGVAPALPGLARLQRVARAAGRGPDATGRAAGGRRRPRGPARGAAVLGAGAAPGRAAHPGRRPGPRSGVGTRGRRRVGCRRGRGPAPHRCRAVPARHRSALAGRGRVRAGPGLQLRRAGHAPSDLGPALLRPGAARAGALCYEARTGGRGYAFADRGTEPDRARRARAGPRRRPQWSRDLAWWSEHADRRRHGAAAPLPFAAADRDERVFAAETRTVDLDAADSCAA